MFDAHDDVDLEEELMPGDLVRHNRTRDQMKVADIGESYVYVEEPGGNSDGVGQVPKDMFPLQYEF